jgi:hypothetical protein
LSPCRRTPQSATGSERLAEPEDPFKFAADVKGEGLAASRVNLDWLAPGFLDLLVGRADDEDVLVVEIVGGARVVEAAGDDRAVVDDRRLVMQRPALRVALGAPSGNPWLAAIAVGALPDGEAVAECERWRSTEERRQL